MKWIILSTSSKIFQFNPNYLKITQIFYWNLYHCVFRDPISPTNTAKVHPITIGHCNWLIAAYFLVRRYTISLLSHPVTNLFNFPPIYCTASLSAFRHTEKRSSRCQRCLLAMTQTPKPLEKFPWPSTCFLFLFFGIAWKLPGNCELIDKLEWLIWVIGAARKDSQVLRPASSVRLWGVGNGGRGRPINNVTQFQSYVSKNKMHLNFSANWIKFAFGGSATFSQIKS